VRDGKVRGSSSLLVATGQQVIFIFMTLTILFPFYYMVVNSLKTRNEYALNKVAPPQHPTLTTYETLFEDGTVWTWYANSVILTGFSVILSIAIASLAAYAFSRFDFKGGWSLYRIFISLMVIPPVVLILPLFVFAVRLGVINTHAAAIVVYVGLLLPFSTFLLTSFFRTIPNELIDAARVDGASTLGILLRIVLPASAPALVTLALVNALFVWNDLLIALVLLQDESLRTLMVGVSQFRSRFDVNIPVLMAGLVLASWPVVITYLAGQRYFTHGLLAGTGK